MSRVIFSKAVYDYATLQEVLFRMLDDLGGRGIVRGSRVLIKPNLLAPAPPESAMLTHPLVVKVVAEYVLEKGGRPQISDSPAMGGFEKVLKTSGIRDALKDMDVVFREFRSSQSVSVGEPFKKIEIAAEAMNADFVINLPKLKTHTQMLLTLGVKNLYGCIVGFRKPEWHFRTGVDREMFALLLVKICSAVKPSVTIMDGILAMEGQGPGKGGIPREVGLLIGSRDAYSLDVAVCKMLAIEPDRLPTNKAAIELGLTDGQAEIIGAMPLISDFKLPEVTPLLFGPKSLHGTVRRHLVQRPVSDDSLCRLCGECWRYCPAKAIKKAGKRISFDYGRCIRCYCCLEVCPHGALRTHETIPGMIARRLLSRR